VVVSFMEFIEKSSLKNISIEYYSVELYPLSSERILSILKGFKDRVGEGIDTLLGNMEVLIST
jgi:hypothetical protein